MRVVGCYLQYKDTILLLLRHAHKPEGNTWALPGGKVDPGESNIDALIRELFEETGYKATPKQVELLNEHQFQMSNGEWYDYITHRVIIDDPHKVTLEDSAHKDFMWITVSEADKRKDLIPGLHELFRLTGCIKETT
jgi:8-oxo-dGTP diphosphatase